ncbi:MAG: acetylornithine deacetylase [Sulfitobacter sp.]
MNSTEILARLVGFDTVSSKSNLNLIAWVKTLLDQHGIPYRITSSDDAQKQNLFASVGPAAPGGVILSGHSDVVPVEGQKWNSDPFKLTERDNRLYGRGTCDMKGFVAAALAILLQAKAANLAKPIHLALSYDEEVGCLGVPRLIEDMRGHIAPVDVVIVGEPTEMSPVGQHKGSFRAKISLTGKGAHSSRPDLGVSAIHYAGKVLQGLSEYADVMKANPDASSALVPNYTTMNTGLIHGGTAPNIIAQNCDLTLAVRFMPEHTVEMHLQKLREIVANVTGRMQAHAEDCTGEVIVEHAIPALRPEPHGQAAAFCAALGSPRELGAVSFGTEAGHFQQAGFSTIILGPGSIHQAHKPNEFIEKDQMAEVDIFLEKMLKTLVA